MIDIQETIKKLDRLQAISDEAKKKKNRLEGEAEANAKRLKEHEERCVSEIGVQSQELPALIKEYEEKIVNYTNEIETILGGINS